MRNRILITLFFCFTSFTFFAQFITKSELIGTWNVVNLKGDYPDRKPEQQEKIDAVKKAFSESSFEFKSDNNFNLNINFIELEKMMENTHWKFDTEKPNIVIQQWKDKDTDDYGLMEIIPKKVNGKMFFMLAKSPFELEVEKSE